MAKISTGSTFGLTVRETSVCRLLAFGHSEDEIAKVFFNVTDSDPPSVKAKVKKEIHKMYLKPGFKDCYKAIVEENAYPAVGKALSKLVSQVDNTNDWLANKAANDVLTRFGPMVLDTEDREVTVRIEGMPELGVPDEGEDE